MDSAKRATPQRARTRPFPDLNPARIAAAGLAVADEGGVGAFTMRAVAERLGVTPMALYHHVPDKAALARLMVDAAIDEQPLAPPTGDWRADALAMAHWMRESVRLHPALAQLRREHRVWTPSMLRLTERWLNIWRRSGLDRPATRCAAAASSLAIAGLVNEEAGFRMTVRPQPSDYRHTPDAQLVFEPPAEPDEVFELAAKAIIEGVFLALGTAADQSG